MWLSFPAEFASPSEISIPASSNHFLQNLYILVRIYNITDKATLTSTQIHCAQINQLPSCILKP